MNESFAPLGNGYPSNGCRVAMIVNNSCISDARVIREAEALVEAGFRVRVFCRQAEGVLTFEIRNGVEFERFNLAKPEFFGLTSGGPKSPIQSDGVTAPPPAAKKNMVPGLAVQQRPAQIRLARFRRVSDRLFRRRRKQLKPLQKEISQSLRRMRRDFAKRLYDLSGPLRKKLAYLLKDRLINRSVDPLIREFAPHALHCHDLDTLATGVAQASKLGIPLVYDAHEIPWSKMPPKTFFQTLQIFLRERRNIKKVNALLTVGEGVANHYVRKHAVPRPIIVYNTPKFSPSSLSGRDLRGDCGLGPDAWLAVYVGNVTSGRGFEQLLQALAYVPDVNLALVGLRRPQFETVISVTARRFDVSSRLFRLPPVPPHEVVPYIRSASFGIFTIPNSCLNYRYAMPNKLFEMTFAGLPIIGPKLVDITKYLQETQIGFAVDQEDPIAIAAGIRHMQANLKAYKPDFKRMILIQSKYGWERQAAKLVEVYSRLPVNPPFQVPRLGDGSPGAA